MSDIGRREELRKGQGRVGELNQRSDVRCQGSEVSESVSQ